MATRKLGPCGWDHQSPHPHLTTITTPLYTYTPPTSENPVYHIHYSSVLHTSQWGTPSGSWKFYLMYPVFIFQGTFHVEYLPDLQRPAHGQKYFPPIDWWWLQNKQKQTVKVKIHKHECFPPSQQPNIGI